MPYCETLHPNDTWPLPRDFHHRFVQERRPVLLRGACARILPNVLSDLSNRTKDGEHSDINQNQKDAERLIRNLMEIVGEGNLETIEVNEFVGSDTNGSDAKSDIDRNNKKKNKTDSSTTPSFSPKDSQVISMPFTDVCRAMMDSSSSSSSAAHNLYMTTQTLPLNDEGRPAIACTPVTQLLARDYLPWRPPLLGNLIPMNINWWMGRVGSGGANNNKDESSSSGLHHDFHDNLYCLLEGTKTFTVAPPSAVKQLEMSGTLCQLYENGRIVYQEQVDENHGTMIRPDGALETMEELVQLELRKEAIEAKLEDLTTTTTENDNDERDSLENKLDEIEQALLEFETRGEDIDSDPSSDEEDDDEIEGVFFGGAATSKDESSTPLINANGEPLPKKQKTSTLQNKDEDPKASTPNLPLNFVVNTSEKVKFETITLQKGDALYLPAGWFHEVKSKNGIHMAVNYWMHPPDVATPYEQPYQSQFWQRDWDARFPLRVPP